jgi:hypothetical protein
MKPTQDGFHEEFLQGQHPGQGVWLTGLALAALDADA